MPIAKITGQGLSAIALSVALLWACLIGERGLVRQADVKRAQALEEIRRLRRQAEPQPSFHAAAAADAAARNRRSAERNALKLQR